MNDACPISTRQVDETIVRLVAFQVFVAAVLGCIGFLPWVAAALALDFFIRGFTNWPISYLARIARFIAKTFGLAPKPINAGPKIFAARMGFFFAVAIAILGFMKLTLLAVYMANALAVFAALESFFSICIGCHIYSLLNKFR